MNQLAILNYVLVFHDGSITEISENQFNAISVSEARIIRLNGQTLAKSSIAKMLSKEDYYKQYPDKKPFVYSDNFKKYESIEHRAGSSQRLCKIFIKSIQQHIEEQGGFDRASQGSKDLLLKFQTKLKQYEAK